MKLHNTAYCSKAAIFPTPAIGQPVTPFIDDW